MSLIEHFATSCVSPDKRLEFWNRVASETYQGLTVDSKSSSIDAQMLRWSVDDLVMIRPRSEAAVVRREAKDSRNNQDRVILHLQHRGSCRNEQRGHSAELRAGDFTLCVTRESYLTELSDENEMLVVEMSRSALEQRLPQLDDIVARRIDGSSAAARILHDFLLSLWRQGDQSAADPEWRTGIANVLLDMVALAAKTGEASPFDRHSPMLRSLLRMVQARLHEPELGTAQLAAEMGVSMRSIQNLFAAIGTTPSAYILQQRLERAAERLTMERDTSITAIAFDLGFNDSAYFARCFRQHFGVPPSLYRSRH